MTGRLQIWFPRGNDRYWGICRPSQASDGRLVISLGPIEFRITRLTVEREVES